MTPTKARERPRCALSWDGTCVVRDEGHSCARPPGHPTECSCYCGEKPPAEVVLWPEDLRDMDAPLSAPREWHAEMRAEGLEA